MPVFEMLLGAIVGGLLIGIPGHNYSFGYYLIKSLAMAFFGGLIAVTGWIFFYKMDLSLDDLAVEDRIVVEEVSVEEESPPVEVSHPLDFGANNFE